MKTVSLFEAHLLRILHGFFGRVPVDRVLKLVETETDCPKCLSRNAVELVKDALQKGSALFLAREGGWRRDRFLREEQTAEGRLWQRTPPSELGLSFSKHSLQFLMWITANHPARPREKFSPPESELTTGDRLLLFLAYQTLRGTEAARGLIRQKPFANHVLLWLIHLADFAEADGTPRWNFSPWLTDEGAWVLEVFQERLSESWLQTERDKHRIGSPQKMRRLGQWQEGLLTQLFDVAESQQRQDVCRFFLVAMRRLFRESISPSRTGPDMPYHRLQMNDLRIADRFEVYQAAAASLRQMDRMQRWNRTARSIGFYDEGYAAAQLWKADWEHLEGDELCTESQARLRQLEPLSSNRSIAQPPADDESPSSTDATSN